MTRRPMLGQELAAAVDRVRLSPRIPTLALHTATCPAIVTVGRRACRCGVSPIQALVEDYTTGVQPTQPIDLGPVYCEWSEL